MSELQSELLEVINSGEITKSLEKQAKSLEIREPEPKVIENDLFEALSSKGIFPKIPKRNTLITGLSGAGKTLYLKYLKSAFRANGIRYSEWLENDYEMDMFDYKIDLIQKFKSVMGNCRYLFIDQFLNSIERISRYDRGWAGYEWFMNELYEDKFKTRPTILVAASNRKFEELKVKDDTLRKIVDLFDDVIPLPEPPKRRFP